MTKAKIKKIFRDNYTGWLFNLPLFLGILIFTLLPVCCSFYYSFWKHDGISFLSFKGLDNYIKIFTDDKEIGQVVINTLVYTLVSIPLSLIVSYFLALLVNKEAKGVKVFRVLYYLPCMIPTVARGLLWKDMFDKTYGVFNKILGAFGLGPYPFFSDASTAMLSVFLMSLWSMGGSMILWLSAFKNISPQYYEAAELDGAGRLTKLIKITIPMSTPMIFYNMIMSVIGTLQYTGTLTFASRDGRGPDNSLYMYAVKIYREAFIKQDTLGYACALAWVLLIVIGCITAVLFKTSKWVFYGEDA